MDELYGWIGSRIFIPLEKSTVGKKFQRVIKGSVAKLRIPEDSKNEKNVDFFQPDLKPKSKFRKFLKNDKIENKSRKFFEISAFLFKN